MLSISNAGIALTKYERAVQQTYNQEATTVKKFGKGKKWVGDHLEGRVHVRRNGGMGAISDGGAYPVAGQQKHVPWKVYRRHLAASVELSLGVLAAAASKGEAAVKAAAASELGGVMEDFIKFSNFHALRDGTGAVATVVTGGTTGTATFDDARGLWEDVEYDIYNGSTFQETITITSVPRTFGSAGEVTVAFSGGATLTAGDVAYWKGSYGAMPQGLDSLIGTGNLQGITVSTYTRYASVVDENSGTDRPLTAAMLRNVMAGRRQNGGKGDIDVLGSTWQGNVIDALYEGQIQFNPREKMPGTSATGVATALGNLKFEADVDAPYGKLFMGPFKQLKRAVQRPLGFVLVGGDKLVNSHTSATASARLLEICENYVENRNMFAKIEDLSEDQAFTF